MTRLRRFVIERDIPGFGAMSIVELCGAARASNQALEKIGAGIQWQHSYVAGDKSFCVYLASDEAVIRKHSELSGIPVTNITEITQIIDPLTANN
jgi:Nickel responsive protein SCO4226-like